MGKKLKEIIWSHLAIETLQLVYDFIAGQSVKEAEKQLERIFERTQLLEQRWAKIGQQLDITSNKLNTEYRYLVQDSYKIIYHETDTEIRIDIVFDTRQNPKKLKALLHKRK